MRHGALGLIAALTALPALAAPPLAPGFDAEVVSLPRHPGLAAYRLSGKPLGFSVQGPGRLTGFIFLELPRKGPVKGSVPARILLDGQQSQRLVLKRRRARGGSLAGRGEVPSVPASLSLFLDPGPHELSILLPEGVEGGAALDFAPSPAGLELSAAPLAPVVLVPPPEPLAVAAPLPGPEARGCAPKRFRLAGRLGAIVPSSGLSTGAAVGVDLSYVLPIASGSRALDHKLRLELGLGDSFLNGQGPRYVPGRGFDPAFTEDSANVPLDLSLVYTLPFTAESFHVYLGAGYALNFVQTTFVSFGRSYQAGDNASGALFQAGCEIPTGPGAVVLEARQSVSSAALGPLARIGTEVLSGTTLTAGYAYYF